MIKVFQQFLFSILLLGIFYLQFECKKIILTSPSPPLINCNIGDKNGISNFNGFEIELLKEIMNQQTFDDWEFECSDSQEWQTKIINTTKYIGYAGRLQLDYKQNNSGILFSQPYWNTGLSILTYKYTDQWLFLNVLSIEICLLIVATILVIGFLTFFLEKFEKPLENYLWNSFSNTFFISTLNLKRSSSRLIQIGFWFLMLMVTTSFTAHLTVIIHNKDKIINNAHQLNEMIVSAPLKYSTILHYYGAKVYYNLDEKADAMKIQQIIQNNELPLDAVIIEDYFARITEYSNCDIYIKQRQFYQIGYALAYNIHQDQFLIQNINQGIQQITDRGFVEQNLNKFIIQNFVQCQKSYESDQINFKQLEGLFLVQVIASAVAIVCFIFTKLPIYNVIMIFLKQNNIVSREIEIPKFGDELVAENLKKTIKKISEAQQTSIEKRMDLLDNRVMEFYQLLLNEEDYRKQNFIKNQIDHIDNLLIESDKTKQDDTSNTKTEKSLLNDQDNSRIEKIVQNEVQVSENLIKSQSKVDENERVDSQEVQSSSSDSKDFSQESPQSQKKKQPTSPREAPGLINVSSETPRSVNLQMQISQ